MNVEYQTKRKFYQDCDEFIEQFKVAKKNKLNPQVYEWIPELIMPLQRLHVVYSLRSEFLDYLTTQTLCFVDNKGTEDETLCYWWQRIHDVMIKEREKHILDLWRTHERNTDMEKSKRRVCSTVAQLSIVSSGKADPKEKPNFMQDLSDTLCTLNDNDMHDMESLFKTDKLPDITPKNYDVIKRRKARQYKGIVEEKQEKQEKKK